MYGCMLSRPLSGYEHLLTNTRLRVTVDSYVERTPTYQCTAAGYSRPLCGRNIYVSMYGCVLQSVVMRKEGLRTNALLRVTIARYVEGTPTYQCMAAC